jgi:hypothetical protein
MAAAEETGEWSGEEDQEEALELLFGTERTTTSEDGEHLGESQE